MTSTTHRDTTIGNEKDIDNESLKSFKQTNLEDNKQ